MDELQLSKQDPPPRSRGVTNWWNGEEVRVGSLNSQTWMMHRLAWKNERKQPTRRDNRLTRLKAVSHYQPRRSALNRTLLPCRDILLLLLSLSETIRKPPLIEAQNAVRKQKYGQKWFSIRRPFAILNFMALIMASFKSSCTHVYIDHIYGNNYRWNKQNTAGRQTLTIYVQNVHNSREHVHSNDYAIAQSLPWWWCGPAASTPSADVLSTPSHHGSANGRPSRERHPRCCSPPDSNLVNWVATSPEG